MRDLSNEITVDGADTINTITGSQRAVPSQEAIGEFRVVNNSFGAIPRRYNDGIGSPANPLFGEPRTMLNPRQLQFAVRVSF